MGAIARFLLALERLARRRGLKIEDAYKFAKQEFGEMTPLLKKQIENVFSKIKKPVVGKPGKKEGAVLPMVKEIAKKEEGIGSLDVSELDEFNLSKDDPIGDLEKIVKGEGDTGLPKNPRRPGGSLDPTLGLTRTLARKILERRNIDIGKNDPIDIFDKTFGTDTAIDVKNLADELLEMEAMGKTPKDLDTILQQSGLFDVEIPKNPAQGMTDDELLDLMQKTEEEEILKDFDPKGRKPNATGGRAQAASGGLAGILKL